MGAICKLHDVLASEVASRELPPLKLSARMSDLTSGTLEIPDQQSGEIPQEELSMTYALPDITISVADFGRLQNVAAGAMSSAPDIASYLLRELNRATIAPVDRAPSSVKMGSLVRYRDDFTGRIRQVRVVYPKDADPSSGRISVLTPVGAALLGMSAGQAIGWRDGKGRSKTLTVLDVQHDLEPVGYLNM